MAVNPKRWGETPGEPQWSLAKPGLRGRSPHQFETVLPVRDYDLAATLDSGQAFRWQPIEDSWHGVIGKHFVRLTQTPDGIHAKTAAPVADWNFLREFLQTEIDLAAVLKTFPDDEPMEKPSPVVADCGCCGKTRGNVSRRSSCLPPNKSSKSGRSSRCSANGLANLSIPGARRSATVAFGKMCTKLRRS